MMMGPTWSCSCRRHRWGCSGSQEQDPLLRFAWRGIDIIYVYVYVLSGVIVIICLCLCFVWWHYHHNLDGNDDQANEVNNIWMWKTYFCFNYLPRLSSWAGPGARLWSWRTQLNSSLHMYTFFVLQSISKSNCQLFNMNTWNSRSQFSNLNTWKSSWGCCLLPPDCCCLLSQKWWLNSYKRINVRTIQT